MNTLLSHSTCNFILWYFRGGKNHSLRASRIIKLDPRKNFTLELECNYWSRWYSDELRGWHCLQAWGKSCLSRGGRFFSIRKISVTCFSYTSSWNSPRWFLLFQISSKKKVSAYCLYLHISEKIVLFSWVLHAIGRQGFTFTLPAPWLWINKIFSYYPLPWKWTGSQKTVKSKHFKGAQQQVHLMIKSPMMFTLQKTDKAVFHCSVCVQLPFWFSNYTKYRKYQENDQHGVTSRSEKGFPAKTLKRQAPILTNRRGRRKDISQNDISGDSSFQSKITSGVRRFCNWV